MYRVFFGSSHHLTCTIARHIADDLDICMYYADMKIAGAILKLRFGRSTNDGSDIPSNGLGLHNFTIVKAMSYTSKSMI